MELAGSEICQDWPKPENVRRRKIASRLAATRGRSDDPEVISVNRFSHRDATGFAHRRGYCGCGFGPCPKMARRRQLRVLSSAVCGPPAILRRTYRGLLASSWEKDENAWIKAVLRLRSGQQRQEPDNAQWQEARSLDGPDPQETCEPLLAKRASQCEANRGVCGMGLDLPAPTRHEADGAEACHHSLLCVDPTRLRSGPARRCVESAALSLGPTAAQR